MDFFSSNILFRGIMLNIKLQPCVVLANVLIACDARGLNATFLAAFLLKPAAKPQMAHGKI